MANEGEYSKSDGDIYYGKDANMAYYQGALATGLNYGSSQIGSPATLVVPSNANRKSVLIRNNDTDSIYIGPAGVTDATGFKVLPNESFYVVADATDLYAYGSPTSNFDVRYLETE